MTGRSTAPDIKRLLLGVTFALSVACFGNIAYANTTKDIAAEQSAMIYDLLSPLEKTKLPNHVDKDIYKKALEILKKEKIFTTGGRPNFQEIGLLDKYAKAMFMGNKAKEYAPDIAKIHDIAVSGDEPKLRNALSDLWEKAGRKRPADEELNPVVNSIYNAKKAQPIETINHVVDKDDHRISIKHSVAGGQMQIDVETKNPDGSTKERTVFQGVTKTTPTDDGKDLEREVTLDQVCTNTEESDANVFEKLLGEWNGGEWVLRGSTNNYVFENSTPRGVTLSYKGSMDHGKLDGAHLITKADDIAPDLPESVRAQTASMGNVTFRIHLEVCGDNTSELKGTWSSQHVTYDGMSYAIKKIHDPYDLALALTRESDMNKAQGAYEKEWP